MFCIVVMFGIAEVIVKFGCMTLIEMLHAYGL